MTSLDRPAARLRALPPRAVDLLVVTVVAWFTGLDAAANDPQYRQADWFTWLLLAVSLATLVWRRRWPLATAVVTGTACAGWALYGHIGELLNLPTIVALYTVAVRGNRDRTLWTGLVASLASGAVALTVGHDVVNPQGLPVLEMLWPLVPLLLGELARTRRQLLDEYAARAARAEQDRESEAARRVNEERVRIARELHDVVAHTVTAMTVQAGVALDAFDVRPEVARRALRQVRDSGKGAVRELRATVTVLRQPEGEPAEPAPGLERIPELVGRFAGGGVAITLHREGAPERAAPVVALAAYRIVQEALTNVVKHAGARQARVSLVEGNDRLTVEVVDDGRSSGTGADGFGLIGMRERALAAGGTLDHGPRPDGGFRVRAEFPADGTGEGEGEGDRAVTVTG
ncbi:sensor histidine kinase [Streptomyces sp. YU58]|uniref:sensor histidine kinase n=1 Tax=Streptomyces sp. SX92 TaxID=3158972 RepID=UPI0027B8FF51|nr:sensor histidine kinase [Streptomyces coralus]WLW50199.1 sensor histidine kinase [Streptomyces coralus]